MNPRTVTSAGISGCPLMLATVSRTERSGSWKPSSHAVRSVPSASAAADGAAGIQEATSFLPDYAFKDSDSALGTTVSGIVGSGIVALAAFGIATAARSRAKKA